MPAARNIALLSNPLHQKALRISNDIEKILHQKGIAHQVFTTVWPANWEGFTEAWVVGGNGTLNYFINHYPKFSLPIAIFKGGHANDFSWMLYGDLPLAEHVDHVLEASPRPVDAGDCNNHLFLNGVGIGFDGKVVQDLLGVPTWNGTMSYYRVVLKNILLFSSFLCTINSQGFKWGKKCLMINIANAQRYGGGFLVNPAAQLNDGQLDVNIVGHVPAYKRFRFLKAIEKGIHLNLHSISYVKTGTVHIKAAGIVPAHADGEYFDASEFLIECLPAKFLFLY